MGRRADVEARIRISRALRVSTFIALLVCTVSGAVILDPRAAPDHILQDVADTLDLVGIDVVQGTALPEASADRPRLSTMKGFKANPTTAEDWISFSTNVWTKGFRDGAIGALLAIRSGSATSALDAQIASCAAQMTVRVDLETCRFVAQWRTVPSEKRLFIAFTKQDRIAAQSVRTALEAAGYVVFTYLRDGARDPWAAPDLVGACFAEASHRYFIDTRNSRGSAGVHFEATACAAELTNYQSDVGSWYRGLSESDQPTNR